MKRFALLMAVVWNVHGLQSISQIEELARCGHTVRVWSPGVLSFVLKPQDDGSTWLDRTSLS